MDNIQSRKLDETYKKYGFRKASSTSGEVNVYTFRSGYFNNAEIVPLVEGADTEADFQAFKKAGYACYVQSYNTVADAEEKLFKGFFSLKQTRERFHNEYSKFYEKQTDVLGVPYKYVNPPYKFEDGAYAEHKEAPLVDEIIKDLNNKGPQLVILEAAAGYGKTCTSFEVLNRSLHEFTGKIPFFVELSRNRQAKIFRYVLLDEANRVFPGLKAELVESEIKSGRLVLILDGFDELLHRAESLSSDFDEVEPMLETISDLLQGNSKIVLTTRRTAIFSGDRFHQWMDNHSHEFEISRRSLLRPYIRDWLSEERVSFLDKENFPILHLSNPVLLAFLSGQDEAEFTRLVKEPENLVDKYFLSLLEREKERQDLIMAPDEQYSVFIKLAERMVDEDFTAEDHEYVKIQIYENNFKILSEVRGRYPSERKPTVEDLATKLVSHALMDRKSEDDDKVGFINDFVLGNFVAEVASSSGSDEWIAAENFIDKAVTAFSSRGSSRKEALWESLKFAIELLSIEEKILTEIMLKGVPQADITSETVNGLSLQSTEFGGDARVIDTVFCGCTFTDVVFQLDSFERVGFVGCSFYGCKFLSTEEFDPCASALYETGSSGDYEDLCTKIYEDAEQPPPNEDAVDEYELAVLQQFWPKGRPHLSHKRMTQTLFRGHANDERQEVTKAIESLQKKGLIAIYGETAQINPDRLAEIRRLLGRGD